MFTIFLWYEIKKWVIITFIFYSIICFLIFYNVDVFEFKHDKPLNVNTFVSDNNIWYIITSITVQI